MYACVNGTPCPTSGRIDPFSTTDNDTSTTNVDFTAEIRHAVRSKPATRRLRQSKPFTIHEDDFIPSRSSSQSFATLLQPPRRTRNCLRDSSRKTENAFQTSHSRFALDDEKNNFDGEILAQAPRRSRPRLSSLPESAQKVVVGKQTATSMEVLRPSRRGTIYIPNEDTTMPSMFMNIFSPLKALVNESSSVKSVERDTELTGIAAQMAMKRSSRTSLASSEPRRGVLRPSKKPQQEQATVVDHFGSGGGKENVPPSTFQKTEYVEEMEVIMKPIPARRFIITKSLVSGANQPPSNHLEADETGKSEKQSRSLSARQSQSKGRPAWNQGPRQEDIQAPPAVPRPKACTSPVSIVTADVKPRVPTRFVVPVVPVSERNESYELLADDVANPAVYEEDWLLHLEISVTQLVNDLFTMTKSNQCHDSNTLRKQLLSIHCSDAAVLMQKRLRAALLYGSLSIPRETLEQGTRLQNDVGLHKSFIDLWLMTYDLDALETTLEVVIGRKNRPSISENSNVSNTKRNLLRKFITAFLVGNDDAKHKGDVIDRISWSYQRTIMRSLLLIQLLDMIKTDKCIEWKGCIFQHSSPHKSSIAVIQSLFQMLHPAAGDPTRALGHFGYSVSHVQHPLDEYDYTISNLAVDLRDGIRLTRLVELLLYPSASASLTNIDDGETTTAVLPEGEQVDFQTNQEWPLSQHLKTSCQSHAAKNWNVQLALSALQNVKGIASLIDGITTDDIVNGYREKTVRLLWALVGKWGLPGLLNWQDLEWEIRRLENSLSRAGLQVCLDEEHRDDEDDIARYSFDTCKKLLRRWARSVASSEGVTIRNFTTSFSDGKAFEAIVKHYEPFIQPSYDLGSSLSSKKPLQQRLLELGCNTEFAQLFTKTRKQHQQQQHIFDRDFVLAALTFLCSRLLAPSRQSRAATSIQRAWRRHWSRIEARRKEQKKKVALACVEHFTLKGGKSVGRADQKNESPVMENSDEIDVVLTNEIQSPASQGSEDIWLTLEQEL